MKKTGVAEKEGEVNACCTEAGSREKRGDEAEEGNCLHEFTEQVETEASE